MKKYLPTLVLAALFLAGCTTTPQVTAPTPQVAVSAPQVAAPTPQVAVLTPLQAIEQAAAKPEGVTGLFELTVRNTGTSSTGWEAGYVFLNSETDYRDQRCLTVAITAEAVGKFKERGIDPAIFYKSQVIRVSGTARRATVYFYSNGVKTDLYYFQTQVAVNSPDQITLLP